MDRGHVFGLSKNSRPQPVVHAVNAGMNTCRASSLYPIEVLGPIVVL